MKTVDHISGQTFHGRRGAIKNAFRYSIDYVLCDADAAVSAPRLFGRNRGGAMSLHDVDHGGPPKAGNGSAWVRSVLAAHQIMLDGPIEILAQPRILGHVFNPVSFWLCHDKGGALRVVIAEVTNTYGDRHSYLCRTDDLRPITRSDRITAQKIFHVSPFQPIEGGYCFRFDITAEQIDIVIDYSRGDGGLVATLKGARKPLSNRGILWALMRRPLGSRRVLGLIHWQAAKLWWKGAGFRARPAPPDTEISQ